MAKSENSLFGKTHIQCIIFFDKWPRHRASTQKFKFLTLFLAKMFDFFQNLDINFINLKIWIFRKFGFFSKIWIFFENLDFFEKIGQKNSDVLLNF